MPLDPATWTPVPTPISEADLRQAPPPPADYPTEGYNPWPSLRPKLWAPFGFSDERGPVLGFTTIGQDTLLQNFLFGAVGYGLFSNRPFYSLGYSNEMLFPSLYAYAMDTSFVSRPLHAGV